MSGDGLRRDLPWLVALWALLLAAGLDRPLLPIDETRYAAVAWEMWSRGDLLLPVLNGEPYAHKPPLLFWLLHAGWALFGVGEGWPRLISPLFAAATLALTAGLARQLWPARPEVARMAPFVLLASLLYGYFATALMFDAMLTFFITLGYTGLVRAARSGAGAGGFMLLALGLAGALYSKGPVALLHLMPLALLAPLWVREAPLPWRRWYGGVLLALLAAAALILAWAVPAAIAGGAAYRDAIFWGQTAGRMSESFAHRAPPWFYLASLPAMLAPWLLWPRWWQGARAAWPQLRAESGWRLALLGTLLCLLAFSLISGKRWQYLLPEFPLFALLVARALAAPVTSEVPPPGRWSLAVPVLGIAVLALLAWAAASLAVGRMAAVVDTRMLAAGGAVAAACALALAACRPATPALDVRRVAVASVVATCSLLLAFDHAMREPYDVTTVARQLAAHAAAGRPLAVAGDHHGQWTFAGRLPQPPQTIARDGAAAWLATHPQGRVVYAYGLKGTLPAHTRAEFTQPYRGGWLALLAAG